MQNTHIKNPKTETSFNPNLGLSEFFHGYHIRHHGVNNWPSVAIQGHLLNFVIHILRAVSCINCDLSIVLWKTDPPHHFTAHTNLLQPRTEASHSRPHADCQSVPVFAASASLTRQTGVFWVIAGNLSRYIGSLILFRRPPPTLVGIRNLAALNEMSGIRPAVTWLAFIGTTRRPLASTSCVLSAMRIERNKFIRLKY